jgi:hypothetical protein
MRLLLLDTAPVARKVAGGVASMLGFRATTQQDRGFPRQDVGEVLGHRGSCVTVEA